jgi:hypothetical protein
MTFSTGYYVVVKTALAKIHERCPRQSEQRARSLRREPSRILHSDHSADSGYFADSAFNRRTQSMEVHRMNAHDDKANKTHHIATGLH